MGAIQQPNRRVESRRAQVHIAPCHRQRLVSGQFLNRPYRRSAHGEVRTERMAEDNASVSCVALASGKSAWGQTKDGGSGDNISLFDLKLRGRLASAALKEVS